jgi:hypothetical protein
VRVRWGHLLPASFYVRAAQEVFWRSDQGFGEETDVGFERALYERSLLRWTTGLRLTEQTRWFEYDSELAVLAVPFPRLAMSVGAEVTGATRAAAQVDLYRVFVRARHDAFRRWIFFELQPEVSWPLGPAGTRPLVLGVMFRLEVQFQERSTESL